MLRLLIAFLTFFIGVAVAALLSGVVTPFTEATSDAIYLEFEPMPPSPQVAPVAPSAPCNAQDPSMFYPPQHVLEGELPHHPHVLMPPAAPPPPPRPSHGS
jgi:hypothetical protein